MPRKPFVSVVVPVYNEEHMLPDCLAALQRQDYGGPYEVIVVNNASTDRSPDIARACGVRLVDEPRKGNVNALRAGISAAQGEIIACTDADTRVPPDWLSRLVTTLTAHPDIVATRGVTVYFDGSPCLRALSRVIGPLVWHMCGANMAFWRWAYDAVGGIDPELNFGADAELGLRLQRLGRVAPDRRLLAQTSARRLQVAFWPTLWSWFINDLWLSLFHRPYSYAFSDIRIAPGTRTRNSRSWLFATTAFVALLCMFIFCATSSGAQVFGPVLSHGPVGPRVVAITFDDGPSPYTAQVLNILARYQVKATFFVIGQNVERHPELASRIVAEGHEIGNHTYSHPLAGAIETPQRFEGELDRTATVIRAVTGVSPTLLRPPHGWRSPWMMHLARVKGYRVVTWNVSPGDWRRPPPQVIADHVLSKVQPGCIILLHDGLGTLADPAMQNTVAALPLIIEGLQARHYHCLTISELLLTTALPDSQNGDY